MYATEIFVNDFFLIKDEGKLRIRFLKNVPVTISILYKLQKEIKWGKESIHNIKVNNTLGKLFLSKIVYWFTFKISNKLKYRYTVISKLFVMFYREKNKSPTSLHFCLFL